MAKLSLEIIEVLRQTARHLEGSSAYQWGHMGSCNCGFLAQEVTRLSKEEIHKRAMQSCGDWSEQLNDYCPTSGLPMDEVITELLAFGFDCGDLAHLERLSNPEILQFIPFEKRPLHHNIKKDVILYLDTWTNMLEDKILSGISLPKWAIDNPLVLASAKG